MEKRGNVRIWYDLPVPMRDGTILYADVYRPDDDEKYPAILNRTPYHKEDNCHIVDGYVHALKLAGYGYNVVCGAAAARREFWTRQAASLRTVTTLWNGLRPRNGATAM